MTVLTEAARLLVREIAQQTIREHGLHLVRELNKDGNFDGGNLCALLELFAEKLDLSLAAEVERQQTAIANLHSVCDEYERRLKIAEPIARKVQMRCQHGRS